MTLSPLVDRARDRGGLGPDDVLASLLPLFRQVMACHREGMVAPLRGVDGLRVDDRLRLRFDPGRAHPALYDRDALAAVERGERAAVDIVETGTPGVWDGVRPAIVGGWQTWEHLVGHHDELTDIASLGLLLTALSCGLDLADDADLARLAAHPGALFRLNPRIHPVIAQVAQQMIHPRRHRRAQDLESLVQRLETYRDQPLDFDLERLAGSSVAVAGGGPSPGLRGAVLETLRDRLFDLSRRNRLLYFRPSKASLDLTAASVPLLLDARNIRPEQLFTWQPRTAARVLAPRGLALGSVIRWDDAPYAAAVLDGLLAQARRDLAEYGQSQLRLVVAMLHWHDLKGDAEERITSPLLLLPVRLTRRRGVRDSHVLHAEPGVAEVNPALRQQLSLLYGLELPEEVELTEDAVRRLHTLLEAQISASEPGLTLTLRTRPRVEVVRSTAQESSDAHRRRSGREWAGFGDRSYTWSYRPDDLRPLGRQIFAEQVSARTLTVDAASLIASGLDAGGPMAELEGVGSAVGPVVLPTPARGIGQLQVVPSPRAEQPDLRIVEDRDVVLDLTEDARDIRVLGAAGNPLEWEVDLTSLTLANLHHRTMSLVRDYHELLDTGRSSPAFDELFSPGPRALDPVTPPTLTPSERHLVVPGDSSQISALARVREGGGLVIQGPPGTGKSQTITNLIADAVARGQRVLFVCQKRAAIDVVHARLRRQGLDELACLIHDAQTDKKAFVDGLRRSYETWLATPEDVGAAEAVRGDLVAQVEAAIAQVTAYERAADAPAEGEGPSLRELLGRLVELRDTGLELTPALARELPTAAQWWPARETVNALGTALALPGGPPVLATSPLRHLCAAALESPRPDTVIADAAGRADAAARELAEALQLLTTAPGGGSPLPPGARLASLDLVTALHIGEIAGIVAPPAGRARARALDPGSVEGGMLVTDARAWRRSLQAQEQARAAASGWRERLEPDDARAALAVAAASEGKLLGMLSGGWRRVRAAVRQRFDAGDRVTPISVTEALKLLVEAHETVEATQRAARASAERWGVEDPEALLEALSWARTGEDPRLEAWRSLLAGLAGPQAREQLEAAAEAAARLRSGLDGLLDGGDHLTLAQLLSVLASLADAARAPLLRAAAQPLLALHRHHPAVLRSLRRLPGTPEQLEFAVASAAVSATVDTSPDLARHDGVTLESLVRRVQETLPRLHEAEAALIVARVRDRFQVRTAAAASAGPGDATDGGDDARRRWSAGRRELEHEFGKTTRYRSIRELASGDAGEVVAAMRPVWLMSPTSVSDTLPLRAGLFDLVVYDEASQIRLEEAVPAMHRATQVVVVGDRMQLPPTQYFTVRSETDEDQDVGVVLDGDSFLAQSAAKLPSALLTWHYRSRSESLIAFSNAAFYGGRLATVPDRAPVGRARPEIVVPVRAEEEIDPEDVRAGVDALLDRPVSLHRMRGAGYVKRTNAGEARYIAGLVRELLLREQGLTVGVVAFSEPQQQRIERELERLARTDETFARRYEEELGRQDGEQSLGLFVKNLENVQGDERDVVIMSVCYAPGPTGRMTMAFGPINQRGGEKRLNVIVSRARRHMVVVTSIQPAAITNVYNDGAGSLRRFLQFAEASSRGDEHGVGSALNAARGVVGAPAPARPAPQPHAAVEQLAAALREAGIDVTPDVGRSDFRCDLALRRTGEAEYRVAVLLDTPARLASAGVGERLLDHPAALGAAGWRVAQVLVHDWYRDPRAVVARLAALVAL